jgi:hypothetical protein
VTIVSDLCRFPVHQTLRSNHPTPKGFANRLMTQADAKNRNNSRYGPNQRNGNAGFGWGTRTGRDDNRVRPEPEHLVWSERIIPVYGRLGTELAGILHEVVGEAVVVVENQKHRLPLSSAVVSDAQSMPGGICSPKAFSAERIQKPALPFGDRLLGLLGLSGHRVGAPLFRFGGGIRPRFYCVTDRIIVIVPKITLLEVAHDILWQEQRNTDFARVEDGLPEFLKTRRRVVLVEAGEHPARHWSDVEIHIVGRVLVTEIGSETTAAQALRDGRIGQPDLELNRGDVLRHCPLENYLADGAQLLAVQLERNECDRHGKWASSLNHISNSPGALTRQGDADHANGEDGDGT